MSSIEAESLRKEREVFKAAHLEQLGARSDSSCEIDCCSARKAGTIDDQVGQGMVKRWLQVLQKVLDGKTAKFYQECVGASGLLGQMSSSCVPSEGPSVSEPQSCIWLRNHGQLRKLAFAFGSGSIVCFPLHVQERRINSC